MSPTLAAQFIAPAAVGSLERFMASGAFIMASGGGSVMRAHSSIA
jgi:hypothetical protein